MDNLSAIGLNHPIGSTSSMRMTDDGWRADVLTLAD